MQLSIFFFYLPTGKLLRPFQQKELVGSNAFLVSFGCFATKCSSHLFPSPLQALVGSNGLGPSTSRLSGVCSNQLSYEPIFGGGNRVRTDDPLLAGQVLYQLSYTPIPKNNASLFLRKLAFIKNE